MPSTNIAAPQVNSWTSWRTWMPISQHPGLGFLWSAFLHDECLSVCVVVFLFGVVRALHLWMLSQDCYWSIEFQGGFVKRCKCFLLTRFWGICCSQDLRPHPHRGPVCADLVWHTSWPRRRTGGGSYQQACADYGSICPNHVQHEGSHFLGGSGSYRQACADYGSICPNHVQHEGSHFRGGSGSYRQACADYGSISGSTFNHKVAYISRGHKRAHKLEDMLWL